jgi:integrase/recombinase XerD
LILSISGDGRRGEEDRTMAAIDVRGPLAEYADALREHLRGLGYRQLQTDRHAQLAADISGWMQRRSMAVAELTAESLSEFFAERRRAGHRWLLSTRAAAPLLGYLRASGAVPVVPAFPPSSPLDVLVGRYRQFLVDRRGLAPGTVSGYERTARLLLAALGDDVDALGWLTAGEVSEFVAEACARPVKVSPRELVSDLRSFLRCLFVEGLIAAPLAQAVPAYASRRAAGMPRFLTADQTEQLLASCDRRTGIGRRDYAVLVVLARLGLRAGEVAALGLDDIDWRAGELRVHGKPRREERLPLPNDVGEAIAAYLRHGRPRAETRAVFVRAIAPLVGLSPTGVTWIVYSACERAELPRAGAHRLRHTAATAVLRGGGSLVEVGQLLGHRRVVTTAIYAKVDRASLDGLARPWPGSAP